MELRVLGPVEVVEDGRRFQLGGPKQRAVLALLIANAGRSVSTGSLINGVYGDDPSQGARRSIQTYVSNLRGELGELIQGTTDGYELVVDRAVVDALRFGDLVSAAKDKEPVEASGLFREALGLWRGHPYADVDGGQDLDAEIRRLDELRMQALEARIDADLAAGYHQELIAEIESLTVEYPLRERFCEQQMVALYRSGRQAEALRAYERTRTYLVGEMGLDPSPDLRALEQRILDQDISLDLESVSSIRRAAVMAIDIADPGSLSRLSIEARTALIGEQTSAIESAAELHGGEVFANSGTAVYLLFPDASSAAAAASDVQRQLAGASLEEHRLRIAIDVGDVETGDEVTGPPVNRSAALVSAGHGGQVLLSSAAQHEITEIAGGGWVIRGLGSHDLRGLDSPEIVHQLVIDGLPDRFPDLRTQAVPASLPTARRGLAGYELRETVGSGVFGVVHRAYQPSVGREVAVKAIRPEWANQADFVRRFEIEAQLVARLEHPHIVPLYDYWREPDGAYLVMRWLRGGTLKDQTASRDLTIGEAHALLADIGPALAFAHRQGVVHRDIRSSNVLFDEEGRAYLADFGIAGDITQSEPGSVQKDVRALAELLLGCINVSDESTIAELLIGATSEDGGFADVPSLIAAWEETAGVGDAASRDIGYTPTRNPYKGLSAFGELDADDFHGRDDLVGQLTVALGENDLVAAVGPSGIGKSSVVKAGLIPALRNGALDGSDQWLITTMVPGAFPFDELAGALLKVAVKAPADLEDVLRKDARGLNRAVARYLPEDSTVVLVVDQFEELFTLCDDEELRRRFLDTLVASAEDPRCRVKFILTLRADFFDRPLAYGEFGTLLQGSTVPVTSPIEGQLDEIVRLPANCVGIEFEPGLPERLVSAVKDQPGGLPLLEFSLTELFDARDSDLITMKAYEASGGVKAALGRRAEAIYEDLIPSEQRACRDIFLRMVTVNEFGRNTRKRVRLSEISRLGYDPRSVNDILSAFSSHRLVTFDRDPITRGPTVEVAHEALLTEWLRLADWIEDQREDLLLHSRLAAAVADWEAADRSSAYLLASGRLSQHEAWTSGTELTLTTAEIQYLADSRKAENERVNRRRRTRRLVVSGFGIAAVVALVLAAAALFARNDAQDQTVQAESARDDAATQAEIAESNKLATASINVLGDDPELSLMLAAASAADGVDLGLEQRRALHAAIDRDKTVASIDHWQATAWSTFGWLSPDGSKVAVSGDARAPLEVYRVSEAETDWLWSADIIPSEWSVTAAFSADSDRLLVQAAWPEWDLSVSFEPDDPSLAGLYLFDANTGDLLLRPSAPGCNKAHYGLDKGDTPAGSARRGPAPMTPLVPGWCMDQLEYIWDESFVDFAGQWWLVDPLSGEVVETHDDDRGVWWVTTTNDATLVHVSFAGGSELRNRVTGKTFTYDFEPVPPPFYPVLAPGGTLLLNGADLLDPATGERILTLEGGLAGLEGCADWPVFSADDTRIAFGCEDARTLVFSTTTGAQIETLKGHTGWIVPGSFDSSNAMLVTGSADGLVKLWDISPVGEVRTINLSSGYYADAGLDLNGDTGAALVYPTETESMFHSLFSVMTRHAVGDLLLFDVQSGSELHQLHGVAGKVTRISPDGSLVVAQSATEEGVGNLRVFDVETGEALFDLPGLCTWEPPAGDRAECGELVGADATDLAWSPDGRLIAMSGGSSGTLLVWDTIDREIEFRDSPFTIFPMTAVVFSPDGSLLAHSSKSGMWIYDTGTWELVTPMIPHTGRPSWVMIFTSDGSELVTAVAHSGEVRIYDTTSWQERTIEGGVGQTRDIALSTDDTTVAVASRDGSVHILDLRTGDLLELISLDDTDITNVEFIDGDTRLLITASTGPIEILTLDQSELLEIARSKISRAFTPDECHLYDLDPCPTLETLRSG